MSSKSHGAYALKNIQKVPSARKKYSLAKGGACWPCHSEQKHWPIIGRDGTKSEAPQKHEVASTVAAP
jgi:hypothetical protein